MAVNKAALFRIFALAMVLAGTAWQSVRAEGPATQHGGDGGSCARSEFRVSSCSTKSQRSATPDCWDRSARGGKNAVLYRVARSALSAAPRIDERGSLPFSPI